MIQFFHVVLDCYQKAGLPLREWISNSPLFNKLIKEKNLGPKEESDSVKVLGLNWCISKDELSLKVPSIRLDVVTKRSALSNCAKLFDPMGFVNPITIQSRIFLQKLWRAGYGWDDPISEGLSMEFSKIIELLMSVTTIALPRRVVYGRSVQLHLFSDASNDAFGCCAYMVYEGFSNLVMSKCRVAPVRKFTIPKMELSAVLMSARLARYLALAYDKELSITKITFLDGFYHCSFMG